MVDIVPGAGEVILGEPVVREVDATLPVVPWPHATANNAINTPAAADFMLSRTGKVNSELRVWITIEGLREARRETRPLR